MCSTLSGGNMYKYNEFSTDIRQHLRYSLYYAVSEKVKKGMKKNQRIPTHMVMGGNVMKSSPENIQEYEATSEETLRMLSHGLGKKATEELRHDKAWQVVPVPIVCPLPSDESDRLKLMNLALNDTEALMYAYVTEAIGVKESVLNQNEKLFASKPSDAHPDNITNYVVVSMMANKLQPQTYAAEVTLSIINREGDYGRRLGEFKRYKLAETFMSHLPTTQHLQPDWRKDVR